MVFNNILIPSGSPVILRKRLSINGNIGHHITQDWTDKCTLLQEMIELREYIEGSPGTGTGLLKGCAIKSFDYDSLLVQYGEHSICFQAQGKGVSVVCHQSSPHYHLSAALQTYLHKTRSLPLLIQGLCMTKVSLTKFIAGFRSNNGYQIIGINPSYLKLSRGNVYPFINYLLLIKLQHNGKFL
ncbi:PREDICTED: uncharacterized protein LOC109592947 [Amphimedon queenslandica]|uniref:Uncharacterized protein n=1 Tax=Amphimedon queenslandica TaxID=400682 RepID=A0A1X7SIB8_AMPQE|nr:PREDICTED: uncharacterized protein LOC109592947 [Amphimedon queenslandica]|eukprot:XP_019863805.1 PREDICTED: uncharacterized protein LOC109592947 [Amphimedon queenslandica]